MSEELSLAIQQICEEKGLTPEDVKATIEDAIGAAYRKDFGDKKTQNIRVNFGLATGKFEVFDVKEVVEDELKKKTEEMLEKIKKEKDKEIRNEKLEINKEDSKEKNEEVEKRFNPRTMISLSDAQNEDPSIWIGTSKKLNVGDELLKKLEVPAEFGHKAAQTAKQVIIQRLREAERDTLYNQYKERVGDLIVGTVQRQEGKMVLVDLGNLTAIMPPTDQVRIDKYNSGAKMKFYIKSAEQTSKGPEVVVSRSHPEILRKLFKLEVPEINTGSVIIKSIARDAGARSKIAVMTKEENLDPIGACIGQRGVRVQTIINELGGEKIDIIEWDDDIKKFITNALAPAKALDIEIIQDGEVKIAKAHVKEDQYSLAIGKGGQNVRLAAQLVKMKVNVVMEKSEDDEKKSKTIEETEKGKGVGIEDEKIEERSNSKDIKENSGKKDKDGKKSVGKEKKK